MRLLVSVRDVSEVGAALAGGADIIDVKDPSRGPLGAPAPAALRAVRAAVPPLRPVSAALGEAGGVSDELAAAARAIARCGVDFVKLALIGEVRRAGIWLRDLVEAVGEARPGTRLVAVAYADRLRTDGASLFAIPDAVAAAGAYAVMLDTASKDGRTLLDCLQERTLARWIEVAHSAGLWMGCAGNLGAAEIVRLRDLGPEVVGVRGAACTGGRAGRVQAERVAALRRALDGRLVPLSPASPAAAV